VKLKIALCYLILGVVIMSAYVFVLKSDLRVIGHLHGCFIIKA
jgi:hypothetical protein